MDDEVKTICECCWKPIEGDPYELDGTTMCEQCFEYHGGFEEKTS